MPDKLFKPLEKKRYKITARQLKLLRKKYNIGAYEMASFLCVTFQTYYRWESGNHPIPPIYAKFLAYVFDDGEVPKLPKPQKPPKPPKPPKEF